MVLFAGKLHTLCLSLLYWNEQYSTYAMAYCHQMLNASIERLERAHRQHGIEMLPNYQPQPFDFVDLESRMVSL